LTPSLSNRAIQVAEILLKDQFIEIKKGEVAQPKIEAPAEEFTLEQFVGAYEVQAGLIASISIKDDQLNVLQKWNGNTYNIVKVSGNTYQISGEEGLSFTFSDLVNGQTNLLTVLQGGEATKAPRKVEVDLSGVKLTDYTGSYYSIELDVTYNLELENEVLSVVIADKQSFPSTLSGIDQFNLPVGLVRFQRTNGVISGFEMDSGRVKNLKFEKK
jgi:hypothetical protein